MPTDSDFWRGLESQFRKLRDIPEAARLTATYANELLTVDDGPRDREDRARLHQLFPPLARAGAIAAGAPNGADTLDVWLNLLRAESPRFRVVDLDPKENSVNVHNEGGWIQDLVLASAEYCAVKAARAFESETATRRLSAATDRGFAEGATEDSKKRAWVEGALKAVQGGSGARNATTRDDFLKPYLTKRTRNAIAEGAHVTASSLQRWHEGKTRLSPDNRSKLATFLKVDVNAIPNS